ncbi:SAM-dependent methyltransferase [Paenibacillus pabuli]|uniref:SAM-dependent methyltransferase n=1 Tax=Paenibacillus pabuli TaxID=1472 RepID=UPI003CF8225E
MSRDEQKSRAAGLELAQIIFIGRTFEEYMKMFNLTEEEIKGKSILDCPGGACSFSNHARERGANPMAADIAYEHEIGQLEVKGLLDIEHTMKQMEQVQDKYRWDDFGSILGLKEERRRAMTDCAVDMRRFPDHYVASVLPELPFANEQFDLTLSAHFLFTYADRLDAEFHLKTILELLRVTKRELRIFPTVDLSGKRYEHMDELKAILEERGYITSEVKTSYEFQRGAHTMLHVVKPR